MPFRILGSDLAVFFLVTLAWYCAANMENGLVWIIILGTLNGLALLTGFVVAAFDEELYHVVQWLAASFSALLVCSCEISTFTKLSSIKFFFCIVPAFALGVYGHANELGRLFTLLMGVASVPICMFGLCLFYALCKVGFFSHSVHDD